jgi:hypothetical protein
MGPTALDPDQLQTVAMIGGTDEETRRIVEEALNSIGVKSFIEGSVVDAVQVYHRDYARARAALQSDSRLAGRWIRYMDEPG